MHKKIILTRKFFLVLAIPKFLEPNKVSFLLSRGRFATFEKPSIKQIVSRFNLIDQNQLPF